MGAFPKHFQALLDLDGKPCCRCGSVDASPVLVQSVMVVDNRVGTMLPRQKPAAFEPAPITFGFNAGVSKEIARWISGTLDRNVIRKSGEIIVLSGAKVQSSIRFHDAMITEVTVPAVDSTSKGTAQLKVTILPERVEAAAGTFNSSNLQKYGPAASQAWSSGQFKLLIDGVNCKGVKTISSLFIKQGVKKFYTGQDRFPTIEPTNVEDSNLVITLPEASADGFKDWLKKEYSERASSPKNGSLEYLAPGSTNPLLSLELHGIIPVNTRLSDPAKPSGNQIAKIEMAIDRIKIA